MLMGLGFTIVALPIAILWVVFHGVAFVFGLLGGVLGGLGKGLGAVFGTLGRGAGATLTGVGRGVSGSFGAFGALVVHLFRFVRGMLGDALRLVGGVLTALLLIPLLAFNFLLLRWRTARHYGGAIEDELAAVALSTYRLAIGHPVRLLGLGALTEGFERRIPDVIARAPGSTASAIPVKKGDAKTFPGYKVLGQLKSGGSGGRLYLAQPLADKLAAFARAGHEDPDKVVIKSFALEDGSTLPQIVRESRALEAARELGYVLEHELTPRRFHYVMPFVDGDELSTVARRMHDASGPEGLDDRHVEHAIDYAAQMLALLADFHAKGLWHKDIKPSNILVEEGRVHLVDLGLVTPLQSAMTLTTHGTEYFRDPEMVRLAMRGVKVHEVDGVKFDLYSAGAVIFSLVENSFPAHGSLSQVSKRCPDALVWVVRRAMADMQKRYSSAGEMLRDLQVLVLADDPFAVRPADLPSFQGVPFVPEDFLRPDPFVHPGSLTSAPSSVGRSGVFAGAGAAVDAAVGAASEAAAAARDWRGRENLRRSLDSHAWRARYERLREASAKSRLDPARLADRAAQGMREVMKPRTYVIGSGGIERLGSDIRSSAKKIEDRMAKCRSDRHAARAQRKQLRREERAQKRALRSAERALDPSLKRRRRVGRGLALAGGLVAASVLGAAIVDEVARNAHRERSWSVSAANPSHNEAELVNKVTTALTDHVLAAYPSVPLETEAGLIAVAARSQPQNPGVLVLCNDPAISREFLQSLNDALVLQSYRVHGLSLHGLADEAAAQIDRELVSAGLFAVALHEPNDPQAAEALELLVRTQPDLEYAVWVTQNNGRPQCLLVGAGIQDQIASDQDAVTIQRPDPVSSQTSDYGKYGYSTTTTEPTQRVWRKVIY